MSPDRRSVPQSGPRGPYLFGEQLTAKLVLIITPAVTRLVRHLRRAAVL
jgi:hypothetical protein